MDTKIVIIFALGFVYNVRVDAEKVGESGKLEEWRRSFKEHGIQPDVIRRIPKHRLIIKTSQDGKPIETASTHQYSDLETIPSFEWKSKPNLLYALFLLNPDVPSRKEAFEAEWQHLVVLNIPGNDLKNGDHIVEYSAQYQHQDAAGLQRMVALVIEQKGKIDTSNMIRFNKETLRKSNSSESRGDFHIKPYIFEAKLNDNGDGYFGDFFYIDARKSNSKTSSSNNEESGGVGSNCKTKNDCQTKFVCVNETCQIFKVDEEGANSPKFRSQMKRSDHSADDEMVETEPEIKDVKFCSSNDDCKDGRICREDHCQNECFVNDDCPNNHFKCEKHRCVQTGDKNVKDDKKPDGKTKNAVKNTKAGMSDKMAKSSDTKMNPKEKLPKSGKVKEVKLNPVKKNNVKNPPKKDQTNKSQKGVKGNPDSKKKSLGDTTDPDTIPVNDEDYEDEGKTKIEIPALNPKANLISNDSNGDDPDNSKKKKELTTATTSTTRTTTTNRELKVQNVVRLGNDGNKLAAEDDKTDDNEDEKEEESSTNEQDTIDYEETDHSDTPEDENEKSKGPNGDDTYTNEDDDKPDSSDSSKATEPEIETEMDSSKEKEAKMDDDENNEKTEDKESSGNSQKSPESGTSLSKKTLESKETSGKESNAGNSSRLPDDLLGYYKYPKECNQNSAGNCRFVVKWFKEKHPNEVKFVIDAYGLNSTGIGFSVDKNLARSDFIEVDSDLIIKDKHFDLKKEVRLDLARNLISATAEKQGNLLHAEFIRQIQTDDKLHDVHLGQQGGVFFYFEGASIGRPNKYIFMPKKIDLSPYFDMSIRQQEMSSFPQHPEEIFGNITMRTVPDQYSNVCSNPSYEGRRFVTSRASFLTYLICSGGKAQVRACPSNALFFYVLQCCIPASKFPCSENCIHDNTEIVQANHFLDGII